MLFYIKRKMKLERRSVEHIIQSVLTNVKYARGLLLYFLETTLHEREKENLFFRF